MMHHVYTRPEHIVTVQVTLGAGYPDSSAVAFYAAFLATRLIQSWLFEVGRADPATYAAWR